MQSIAPAGSGIKYNSAIRRGHIARLHQDGSATRIPGRYSLNVTVHDSKNESLAGAASAGFWPWLIGGLLLAALVWIVESEVGWASVLGTWSKVSPEQVLAAFALYLLSQLFRALRIRDLMAPGMESPLPIPAVMKLTSIHQSANNLLPMRLGELAFPVLARRYAGLDWWSGIYQLLWLRALDAALIALVITATLASALEWRVAALFSAALVVSLVLLVLSVRFRHRLGALSFIQKLLEQAPRTPALIFRSVTWTVLIWASKLVALATLVRALSGLPLDVSLLATLGAEISSLLPVHGIAGSGTFEAAFVAVGALVERNFPALISAAVNLHIFVLLASSAVTLAFLPLRVEKARQRNPKDAD